MKFPLKKAPHALPPASARHPSSSVFRGPSTRASQTKVAGRPQLARLLPPIWRFVAPEKFTIGRLVGLRNHATAPQDPHAEVCAGLTTRSVAAQHIPEGEQSLSNGVIPMRVDM